MKVLGSIQVFHICIDLWVYIVPIEIENTCIVCYIELTKGLQPTLDALHDHGKEKLKNWMIFPFKIHYIIEDKLDFEILCALISSHLSSSEIPSKPTHYRCNITNDHTNRFENISGLNWGFPPT